MTGWVIRSVVYTNQIYFISLAEDLWQGAGQKTLNINI